MAGYGVQRANPCKIVDANDKLDAALIQAVGAAGYAGVARYVPLPGVPAGDDIDAGELQAILEAGLGLLLVQHCRYPGWDPGSESGGMDAANAVRFANQAGYLRGAHIFLDLEGISVTATAAATKTFAEAWANAIVAAGYLAGCYVGYDVPLTPEQLYDLHNINSYWSDMDLRQVAWRGFAMKQHAQILISGKAFDPDDVQLDNLGDTPAWMVSDPMAVA